MAIDDFNKSFPNLNSNREKLEILKSMRVQINWGAAVERVEFYRQFCSLIGDWESRLPDLREIFRREDIDWLLTKCVETGAIDLINFFIRTGYKDEPYLDPRGEPRCRRVTPIHHAARRKYHDVVRRLFEIYNRFDVNYAHPSSGLTHFHAACASGCVDIVERFIDFGHHANCLVQPTGDSLLHLALRNKQKEVIELLLKRGGDPNLANAKGETPLHVTDREYYDAGCVNALLETCDEIERSVQIDARDELGYSPLLRAVHSGNAELVIYSILLYS